MNIVKKLSVFILVFLLISGSVFGATVTLKPSTVPIGAYLNGSDGDQYFVQSLVFTIQNNGAGAWADGEDLTINLPSNMYIASVDDDANYDDEVSITTTAAGAIGVVSVASATSQQIVLDIATASGLAAGDKISVFFPIVTNDGIADGTQETYSFSTTGGDEELSFSTITVTYDTDVISFVTFAADYSGGDASTEKGDVYPAAVQAVTAALPNLIEDLDALANDQLVNAASDWDGITLDNDDNAVAGGTLANAEAQYYIWATQDSGLIRIDEEAGGHKPIVYLAAGQPTRASAIAAVGGAGDPVDSDVESGTFSDTQFNGTLLTEGEWYFYITSSVTCDWVLAQSGVVDIKHHPVFENTVVGNGGVVDFDGDGIFEPGPGADDNVAEMYLESGGGVGKDGTWGGTNTDNVKFHWNVTDVDDNANVKIFKSTTDGITEKAALLADANTVQISPDTLYEEGAISQYWSWDIYTSATDFETAGDFYIYMLADDGKNSNVFQMTDNAAADFVLKVKHFPNLVLQNIAYLHDETPGGNINFETSNQQYLTFNWGETVDGDKDADGDQKITLYLSTLANAGNASGYNSDVSLVDTTVLANAAVNSPTTTALVATLLDTADGRDDNRYAFDVRNSGLAAGSYYMYAVITEKGDAQVIQLNTGVDDNLTIDITHSSYLLPSSPPQDEIVNLKSTDRYTFTWDGFNKAAPANFVMGIFAVPQGTDISAYTGSQSFGANEFCLTSTDGDDANISLATVTNNKVTVDFGTMAADCAAGANTMAGDYDIYFVYEDAEANVIGGDAENPVIVQADGYINIATSADPATSFELSPNRFVAEKGDTISLDIYATDGTVENAMVVSVYMDIPATKFSVVDQDNATAGIQPWSDESANFNGTAFVDTLRTNGSVYELDYIEYAAGGDALATSLKIGTIQLVVTGGYDDDALEPYEVTFSTTGDRTTSIVGASNNTLATTVPSVAATIEIQSRGKINGHVELDLRDAEGETVDIYVCHEGSINQISDADYLSANGLTSATDTLTVTLGAGGFFEITNVPTGTYDVFVHKDGYLDQRIASQSVQPLSTTLVDFEGVNKMLAGDCAGYTDAAGNIIPDNQVDASDVNAITTAFLATPASANWNAYADFDNNNVIHIPDLNAALANTGSGEGILYKNVFYEGTNSNARFTLVNSDENVFSIKANDIAHIRTYAAVINFNSEEWKVKNVSDGLSRLANAYNFHKVDGNTLLLVSGVYGRNAVKHAEFDLANFGLTPLVDNPSMPELVEVNIIDAFNSQSKGYVESSLTSNIPTEFKLEKNYPNPFNPTTNIKFAIPEQGMVKLVVYDLLGNKISTLVANDMKPGNYQTVWNATNDAGLRVSSGVYFYRLMIGNKIVDTKKMVLMK